MSRILVLGGGGVAGGLGRSGSLAGGDGGRCQVLGAGGGRGSGEGSVWGCSLRDVAKSWVLGVGRGSRDGSVWGGYWEQGEALAVWLLALAENLTE